MAKLSFRIFAVILFISFTLPLCTCGLDVYEGNMLHPPYGSGNATDEDEPLTRVFKFTTAESYESPYLSQSNSNNSYITFNGTIVYYKIYNSLTAMNNERSYISSANSQYSSSGALKAIDLGYKQLKCYSWNIKANQMRSDYYSLPDSKHDRSVTIRLFTEGDVNDPYQAGFYVGETDPKTDAQGNIIIPWRNAGSKEKDFDFFDDDGVEDPPEDVDDDYLFSAETSYDDVEEGQFYVAAYAASYGTNYYLTTVYSQLLPLGYVIIKDK